MTNDAQPGPREETNALTRVLRVLEPASKADNVATYDVWTRIFQVTKGVRRDDVLMAARLLIAINEEWDRAYVELQQSQYTPDDYQDAADSVALAISPVDLSVQWDQNKKRLSGPVLGVLRMASRTVPATEAKLTSDELSEVKTALDLLGNAVDVMPRGDSLGAVLREQIAEMNWAIIVYPIVGSVALRRSVYALEGALRNQAPANQVPTPETKAVVSAGVRLLTTAKRALLAAALIVNVIPGAEKSGEVLARTVIFYQLSGPAERLAADVAMSADHADETELPDYVVEPLDNDDDHGRGRAPDQPRQDSQ